MASYTSQIVNLFEELTGKYLKCETMKYINMELFKKDFVEGVARVIDEFSVAGEYEEDELEDLVCESVSHDVPFGFDSSDAVHDTDFDAQTEIEKFIMDILKG